MKTTGSREGFGNEKPLWKQRRGHLLQFPDHKATEKENSSKNLGKTKETSGCASNLLAHEDLGHLRRPIVGIYKPSSIMKNSH